MITDIILYMKVYTFVKQSIHKINRVPFFPNLHSAISSGCHFIWVPFFPVTFFLVPFFPVPFFPYPVLDRQPI